MIANVRHLQRPVLYSTDLKLLNHVLSHSMDFYKPEDSRNNLSRLLGDGTSPCRNLPGASGRLTP